MAIKYDAIVIGTGQAGPPLAARLADTGLKVAIIERKRHATTAGGVSERKPAATPTPKANAM
jgi:pyruvate/2-oxoglutarate dehydrogenase complex dihydrolipoamide dehydrogenase (E3) component